MALLCVFTFAISSLLIHGLRKRSSSLLLPYIIMAGVELILKTILNIAFIIVLSYYGHVIFSLNVAISSLIGIVLQAWAFLCVYSYRQQLLDQNAANEKDAEAAKDPKDAEAAKNSKDAKAAKNPKDAETSKDAKYAEAAKNPKDAKASKDPKYTEAARNPKDAKASIDPKYEEAAKNPKDAEETKDAKYQKAKKEMII